MLIRVSVFIAIVLVAIYIGYRVILQGKEVGVVSPADITNEALVDSTMREIQSGHTVSQFRLVDQHGDTITREDLEGKITVVNFFFTSCQGICPEMNGKISQVVEDFEGQEKVQFFSHTVDPSYDTVEVLRNYAERFPATEEQWHFLTGSKDEIYRLARRSYFAVKSRSEAKGEKSDFIHTENVILVGPELRLRGFYTGTSDKSMEELKEDIRILLR